VALLFCDGFDHYDTGDILKKWTSASNWTPSASAIAPGVFRSWARPPGGQGLQLSATNQALIRVVPGSATPDTFIMGFYYRPTLLGGGGPICFVRDGATEQLSIRLNASGQLIVSRNGTTLATSTNTLAINTWYHIEWKATINNATGAYEVRVNGSSTGWIPAATGANTRATANNQITDFAIGGTSGASTGYYDDFYILDTAGSTANDFAGPQKVHTLYAAGPGNYAQWIGNYAANYANVNETIQDSDETFNQSSTAAQKDSFVFDDVPTGTVVAVQHVLVARQDAGAARTVRPIQRTSGTDYAGKSFPMAGSYAFYLDPRSVDPATSTAWTASGVNGAEFGYELVS